MNIESFRKNLEDNAFRDLVGDRFNVPQGFDPVFRMFCGLLTRTRRVEREMHVLRFCEEYGPIPQEYQPYLRTLLELKPKDKKGIIESDSHKQKSLFGDSGSD